jgi:hypothetical protein
MYGERYQEETASGSYEEGSLFLHGPQTAGSPWGRVARRIQQTHYGHLSEVWHSRRQVHSPKARRGISIQLNMRNRNHDVSKTLHEMVVVVLKGWEEGK